MLRGAAVFGSPAAGGRYAGLSQAYRWRCAALDPACAPGVARLTALSRGATAGAVCDRTMSLPRLTKRGASARPRATASPFLVAAADGGVERGAAVPARVPANRTGVPRPATGLATPGASVEPRCAAIPRAG